MNKLKQCVVAAAAAMMGAMSASALELVTNGGFEEGCNPGSSGWLYKNSGTQETSGAAATGWTLSDSAGISHADDTTWMEAGYPSGSEVVCFLQSYNSGTAAVQQSITVSEAGRYTLTFDYVARGETLADLLLTVYVDDTSVWSATLNNTSWTQAVQNVELTSGSHTLKFVGTHSSSSSINDNCGCIDNVSLTPASPVEVSDWATLKSKLSSGYDVKLVGKVTQDTAQPDLYDSQNVTLDLNGYTIDRTGVSATVHFMRTDSANVTLTITDSSANKTGRVAGDVTQSHGAAGECIRVNSGKVIINGGTFEGMYAASSTGGGYAYIASGATLEMNGGTITGCKTIRNGGAIYNDGGTFTMNGGTIENCTAAHTEGVSASGYGGGIYLASGTCDLKGGTITGCGATQGGAYAAFGGTCNIYSGMTINSTVASGVGSVFVQTSSAKLNVHGGVFMGTAACAVTAWDSAVAKIYGGYFPINAAATLFNQDGVSVTVAGGVFGCDPSGNTKANLTNGKTQVGSFYVIGNNSRVEDSTLTGGQYTFSITNAEYAATGLYNAEKAVVTGSDAAWNVKTIAPVEVSDWATLKTALLQGCDVKLMGDVTQTTDQPNLISTQNVTLDLNGCTIDRKNVSNAVWFMRTGSSSATLTITDTSTGKTGRVIGDSAQSHAEMGNALRIDAGKMIINGGTFENMYSSTKGGFAYVASGATLEMNGGTISNCTASGNGGAIYNDGTVTMNGGTITNCTSSTSGGAIYNAGMFTMNGGAITGCSVTWASNDYCHGGGAVFNAGTVTMNGGSIKGNRASDSACGGAFYLAIGSTTTINDGTIKNNECGWCGSVCYGGAPIYINGGEISSNNGYKDTISDSLAYITGGLITNNTCSERDYVINGGATISGGYITGAIVQKTTVAITGGVFDRAPTSSYVSTGYALTLVGLNYVVGQSVTQADDQLTGGTYTFCPTNDEYAAAGVAVAPWVDMTKDETVDPKTWTLTDNTEATDVGTSAKARMKDGVCWITGTGATSDAKPIDSQWVSVKEVRITDGVTGIGTYFFDRFFNLTNVTVAASVTNLCEGAFYRCFSLEQITFEGEMPDIGNNALVITAGIRMEGGDPVVYAVPNVTVNGKSMTLKGSNDLQNWEDATGNEGAYHFFKFVAE